MNKGKIMALSAGLAALLLSSAYAADAGKGKALFNDAKLGGGTAGKSCNTCHAGGSGIDGSKKEFMGGKAKSLEGAVNMCITMMLQGKALDPKSAEMANITAYIRTLKKEAAAPMKKKSVEGC